MPMNARYLGPGDLPEVIPVFPLAGALLPPRAGIRGLPWRPTGLPPVVVPPVPGAGVGFLAAALGAAAFWVSACWPKEVAQTRVRIIDKAAAYIDTARFIFQSP